MTRRIFHLIPVPIIPTTQGLNGAVARSFWFKVHIRPDAMGDEALIQHELEHCRQAWRLPVLHVLLYRISRRYRLWAEISAHRVQVAYGMSIVAARRSLWEMYGVEVSEEELA